MQKFGFLNHGFIKDASPCGIHLQSVFSVCPDHFKAQTSGESRAYFPDPGDGIFCIGCAECGCERMDGITPDFA